MSAIAINASSAARARYAELMAHAADPSDPDAHVVACAVSARLTEGHADLAEALGLDREDFGGVLLRLFPRLPDAGEVARAVRSPPPPLGNDGPPRLSATVLAEEMADLRALLLDGRTGDHPLTEALASILARTCLFPDHLWQNLGLFSRGDLSALMARHFGRLAARNTGDMKWKKFFYKQLCDRSGLNLCKAPSCGVCTDRPACFGPEESDG